MPAFGRVRDHLNWVTTSGGPIEHYLSTVQCEQKVNKLWETQGETPMWMKDAVAGAGLIVFVMSSFVLAGALPALFGAS